MTFHVGEMVKFETKSFVQRGEIMELLDDAAIVHWYTVTYKEAGKTLLLNKAYNMGYEDLQSLETASVEDKINKYQVLMHIAVETGDKEEFYRLAEMVNELKGEVNETC